MNKRLEELAAESGIGYLSSVPPDMLKKFAMLVVNECYNRAEGQWRHNDDEWDKGVMAVMDSIEELFRS